MIQSKSSDLAAIIPTYIVKKTVNNVNKYDYLFSTKDNENRQTAKAV